MKPIILLFSFFIGLLAAHGQSGSLDPSFAGKGWTIPEFEKSNFHNEFVGKVLPLNNGAILVAFEISDVFENPYSYTLLARYLSDGTLDHSFGTGGYSAYVEMKIRSAALQTDGKIVVAGFVDNISTSQDFALARFNSDGSLDSSFGDGGKVITDFGGTDLAFSMAIQSDGKITIGGFSNNTNAGGNPDFAIARYNSDGSPDNTFDDDGQVTSNFGQAEYAYALAIQSDGKIVMAGRSEHTITGTSVFALARYNSNGSLDTSFGSDGIRTTAIDLFSGAYSVAIQSDGKIVAAGDSFDGFEIDFAIARYNSDGSPDNSFDGDGQVNTDFGSDDFSNALVIQSDGKITVSGQSDGDFALARYDSTGSLDSTFDGDGTLTTDFGGDDVSYSVALQPDGKIVAGGEKFDPGFGNNDFAIARYNSDGSPDNTFDGDGRLTGYFNTSYSDLTCIAVQEDGKVVMGGFTFISPAAGYNFTLARYNADGSPDNTFGNGGKQTTEFGGDDYAYSLAIQPDGKIVLAGTSFNDNINHPEGADYASVTGNYYFAAARYNSNGSLDSTFDGDGKLTTSIDEESVGTCMALQSDGKIVMAGYAYNNLTFDPILALTRYNSNGSLDSTFDGDGILSSYVMDHAASLVIQSDGKIVVAGTSDYYGTGSDFTLARYNSDGSPDNTFDEDGAATTDFDLSANEPFSVTLQDDGKIVAAGYTIKNGTDIDFALARYNGNGTLDSTFDGDGKQTTSFGPYDYASSLAIQADGKIIATGNTGNDFALARFNSDGSPDNTFDGDGKVTTDFGTGDEFANASALRNGRLYVAGRTTSALEQKGLVAAYTISCVKITFYRDYDKDGFGSNNSAISACTAPAGHVTTGGDCNDKKSTVYPGAPELCDALDNDCDGVIDDGLILKTFYRDYDKDGFGNNNTKKIACIAPYGYVADGGDRNDMNKTVYPGAPELCDNLDNDCDGLIDEGLALKPFYRDHDNDGYGNSRIIKIACIAPPGYSAAGGDCTDAKNTVYPGAPEIVNGIDDNCNGIIDENTTVSVPNTAAKEAPAYSLQVKATPNPSARYFNLAIKSSSDLPVQVRVLNVPGNTVENRSNIASNTTLQIGAHYGPGVYMVEVVQGTEKRTVKLLKQAD